MRWRISACSLALALLLSGCSEKEDAAEAPAQPRPVAAFQVGASSALGQRQFSGLARAGRISVLSFRVPGQIISLPVTVGQDVRKGDLVAALDSGPYDAEVTRLEAELEAAAADVTAKSENYDRISGLVKTGVYSQALADESLGKRDSAIAKVASVRASIVSARIDLDDTVLKAPYDGRVVAVYPETFEEVRPQQQIVRLLDINKVEAIIDIPETMISLVPLVEKMSVRFDAFPETEIEAQISEVGAEASQTTRTYPVTLVMDQPSDVKILPGMTGNFKVKQAKAATQSLVVPPTSLRPIEPGSEAMAVWVVKPGEDVVTLRPVTLGRVVQGGVEVIKGLSAGEWVVSAGANTLVEGERVLLPKEEPAS